MDKEKIILLIVGAIIGFVVSLAKDWLMEGKKQKEKYKQFKREKLEELYVGFSKWSNYVSSNKVHLLSVMENKITFNQYFDLHIDAKIKFDAQRNEMILKVYAESLLLIHEEIMEQLKYMNQIEYDYQKIYNDRGPHSTNKTFIDGIGYYLTKYEEVSKKFKDGLILEIQKII